MKTILATTLITLSMTACASANAHSQPHTVKYAANGNWVLNPNKCPDLVEDRRDRRESRRDEAYDRGPRDVIEDWVDRKESRRDEAITNCPASAWEWHGPRYRRNLHPKRPVRVQIYYQPHKRVYYRRTGSKRIVIRF